MQQCRDLPLHSLSTLAIWLDVFWELIEWFWDSNDQEPTKKNLARKQMTDKNNFETWNKKTIILSLPLDKEITVIVTKINMHFILEN